MCKPWKANNAFNLTFDEKDIEEVKKVIIYCEVLKRQYPNGRGGSADYTLDFFDEYFNDDWNYDWDGQIQDSMEDYDVYYYDENSVKYDVSVELSPEDKVKIESYGILR